MWYKLPSLTALRTFDVVGSSNSLRRAANELQISHSVVARHMRQLESWFGVKLLATTAKGTHLTREGRRLHEFVQAGFEKIARGTQELVPVKGRRNLRISCTPALAIHWIAMRLPELQRRLWNMEVVVLPSDETPDFHKNEADVAVIYGESAEPGLVCEPLVKPLVVVVATPSWIEKNPECRDPRHLVKAPLLHESGGHDFWRMYFEALNIEIPSKMKGPKLGMLPATLSAACLGYGPALSTEPVVRSLLKAGSLQVVVEEPVSVHQYSLVCREERTQEASIVAFKEWIKEGLASP